MRILVLIGIAIVTVVSGGCVSKRPAPQLAGVFKNNEGRHMLLQRDGYIFDSEGGIAGAHLHFIGVACPERKHPEKIFVVTPSSGSSQWMGVTLLFSPDFQSFDVFECSAAENLGEAPKDRYERVY